MTESPNIDAPPEQLTERLVEQWAAHLDGDTHVLPILGPVHVPPDGDVRPVLRDILTLTPGRFLPYDKNARWLPEPRETLLPGDIESYDDGLLLPTVRWHGRRTVHVASRAPSEGLIARARDMGAATIRATVPLGPDATEHLVFLKRLTDLPDAADPAVVPFSTLTPSVQGTFAALAADPSLDGFSFLLDALGTSQGETLCALAGGTIIGAMGPLSVVPDPWGVPWLLPAYFGVLASARRHGVGAGLWRAAMRWGVEHGARYALLQNTAGTPATAFYLREGLTCARTTWTLPIYT